MKRDLKRFYRQHGIRLFALPLVVVLLLAVLADQYLGSYLEHREEAADLQAQRERQREILRLDAMVRRSNEALAASHASAAARMYIQGMLELQRHPQAIELRQRLQFSRDEQAAFATILAALAALPAITSASYAERVRQRVAEVLPEALLPQLRPLETA